ncbi:MAG TPA: hypothetical protein VK623_10055 [Flavobacterium sp.]|nr:hypothetical protein [Flavobacterium sp.]
MMAKRIGHIIMLFFALSAAFLHAQDKKKINQLVKSGTLEIYENPDKAIKIGNQAIALAGNDKDLMIKGLMLIADAYSSKRDYEKSLEYVIRAKDLSTKIDRQTVQIMLLTKAAIICQQLKIYDKALQYLDESDKLGAVYPIRDSVRFNMGNNFIIRGFIYKEQLNCDIAISYFKDGMNEYRQVTSPLVNANMSIVTYNIGNCLILLSDNAAAKKSYMESIAYAEKVDAKSLKAFAQKGLAEVYTLEGKYDDAIKVLLEAMKSSSTVGDLVLNQGIYKGLSENYLAVNDWGNYRKFHQQYLDTQLKTTTSERKSVSDSLNESSGIQNQKLAQSKSWYTCGMLVFAALSLLAITFIIRDRRKSKKRLFELREKIKKLQIN